MSTSSDSFALFELYQGLKNSTDVAALYDFLRSHPDSAHGADVRSRIHALEDAEAQAIIAAEAPLNLEGAKNGNPGDQLAIGLKLAEKSASARPALQWLLRVTENLAATPADKSAAFYEMGNCHARNWRDQTADLETSKAESFKWTSKAAELGHSMSMRLLASDYLSGNGVPQDAQKSIEWKLRAFEAEGRPYDLRGIGDMFLRGTGIEQNDAEAAKWYSKAAELGDQDSMMALGALYLVGRGVPKNTFEAEKWFSASVSDPVYLLQLARLFENGTIVPRSIDRAICYYWEACRRQGPNSKAMGSLARLHMHGVYVPQDLEIARRYFIEAQNILGTSSTHYDREIKDLDQRIAEQKTKELSAS